MSKNPGGYITLDFQGINYQDHPDSPVSYDTVAAVVRSGKPIYIDRLLVTDDATGDIAFPNFFGWVASITQEDGDIALWSNGVIVRGGNLCFVELHIYNDNTFEAFVD